MNILFTISYYSPYVSGLTLAARRWIEGMQEKGHTCTVLAMQHSPTLPEEEILHQVSILRAAPLLRISKGFLSVDWLIKLVHTLQSSDVVVINLPQFEGLLAAIVARIQGKRVVSIYHCEVLLPKGWINDVVQSLLEVANCFAMLCSHHVITYTEDYAKKSRVLRVVRTVRSSVVISYIMPPIPTPEKSTRVRNLVKTARGKATIVIGVAARLAEEKGIEYLLEAIPFLQKTLRQPFRILLAGSPNPVGEEAYRKRIDGLIHQYSNTVNFLGEIAPEEMGSFYEALTVLLLPSTNSTEAFGMVQVEAMLCGVPVIASSLPGVRVPVQKTGMGLLVPPRSTSRLVQAITTVVTDPTRFIGKKDMIRNIFSPEASITAFEAALR